MSARSLFALTLAAMAGAACNPDHQPTGLSSEAALFRENGSAGPSVTGRAEFTIIFPFGPVTIRYSVSAVTEGNGEVSGEVEFLAESPAFPQDIRWHARVLCLTVEPDGKTARVGARIDGLSEEVGFTLVDNGVGSGSAPDLASPSGPRPDDPVRGALDHCAGKTLPLPLSAIDRGDLQVRP